MKRVVIGLLLATCGAWSATPPFVYETAVELHSRGDFNGDNRDDLVIVDRATGDYRIAYQQPDGSYVWVPTRASGIADTMAVGIGRLNSLAFDSLAFTGPFANRVNILDAENPAAAGLPTSFYIPSVGPNLVAAIDIGGSAPTTHADLYVASRLNSPGAFMEHLVRNPGTTNRTLLGTAGLPYLREDGNLLLLHTNRAARLGVFERQVAAGTDIFSIYDFATGASANVASVGTAVTPQPYSFVYGQFIATNPFTQVLLYPPTGYYFYTYQVTETSGIYGLSYTNAVQFTNFVQRLVTLPGDSTTRLLVIYTNEVSAAVYDYDGAGTLQLVQQFNAAVGEHFTGAGVLPNNGFMAFSAPLGQETSSRFSTWRSLGTSYTNTASGDLPRLSRYSGGGNVLQFQYEPFVTNRPVLLRLNAAGDWSSQPQLSGSPLNVSVRTESFLNSTQGLGNPVTVPLGRAHPLAAFGLGNQYASMISLFSFTPAMGDKVSEVSISPPGGIYSAAIQLRFNAVNPTDMIWYRIGTGPWQSWIVGSTVRLFTNTVVQFYGQPLGNAAKSSVQSAAYAFSVPPGELDSDGDGVPDFVELGRGLDPNGGRDSDGDGYSDLEELIRNRNPLDNTSVPTNFPHLNDQAAFDMKVTPLPWDGFSNRVTLTLTSAPVRAYDLQGSLLGSWKTEYPPRTYASLSNLAINPDASLLVRATDLHYGILTTNVDRKVGREMVGLFPMPELTLPSVGYSYGGSNLTAEAMGWITAASNTFRAFPRTVIANELGVNDSLTALLVERLVAELLRDRGSNWWTNLTLFPFRVSDAGRTNPAQSVLLSLENATPTEAAYRLVDAYSTISNLVENSTATGVISLRAVARDIYRISSRYNNDHPADLTSPIDALRGFLWTGTLDSNYLAYTTTAAQFVAAFSGAAGILAAVPPRPTTNVVLVVRPDSFGECRILDVQGGGTFALQDFTGQPFGFPDSFDLIPGSRVQVAGYTDVRSACGGQGLEVTTALLAGVPIASDEDADHDLLIDTWEEKFFGGLGVADPFADTDLDGYSDLQEMLEGSDPRDFHGRPVGPLAPFSAPTLSLAQSGAQMEILFAWPSAYVSQFDFGVRHTAALGTPFVSLPVTGPMAVGPNLFKMVFDVPTTSQHFFYLTVALK